MRVLVVEDDIELLRVLTEALSCGGHQVSAAASFSDAYAMLSASIGWDALVTDVRLPGGGSGEQLAQAADALDIPHLLITGYPDEMMTLAARGEVHLAKPFNLDALLEWVSAASAR
jgi:two-component system cell cycle response regulator CpdR